MQFRSRVSAQTVLSGGPFEAEGKPDVRVHEWICVQLPSAALRHVDSCFKMCVSLYLSCVSHAVLVIIVAARVIATLVVYDEMTEQAVYFAAVSVPAPSPSSCVIARPFWPRPLLPRHFFLHFDTIFDYVYFPSYSELVKAFKLILVGIINLAAVL